MLNNNNMPNAKDYRMAIKRGLTISDIREKFGFQNETDVMEHIRNQYERVDDYREVLRALKKNEKHHKKGKLAEVEATTENISSVESHNVTEELAECTSEEMAVQEEIPSEEPKKTNEELLAEKKAELEEKRRFVADLELERKALNGRKAEIIKDLLPKLKQELERLKAELQEARNKAVAFNEELNNIADKGSELSELIKMGKEEVLSLEEQLAELKMVNICVYADGNLEVLDGKHAIPEIEQNEWLMVVANHSEICENLTISQVKSVCQLKKLVAEISQNGEKAELVFENELAETLYKAING